MKIHKKIGLGLGLFILSVLLPLFVFSQKTLAAPVSDATFKNAQFRISSRCGTDSNKLDTVRVNIDGKEYAFVDKDPCDNTKNLKFYGSTSFLCNQSNAPPDYGITVAGPAKLFPGGGSTYDATIKLIYWTNTDEPCKDGQQNKLLESTPITLYYNVTNIPPPGSGGGDSGGGNDGGSCAENSNWALSWLACPLLTGAADFTNYLLDAFESLLSFTIPQDPTDDGMVQVKQSWTIFRTLASALLVIVLLVVVISQAIGGTFLDAYSVRKMLPKIVIAVIAMQLSWSLIVWVVVLVDHLGKGLADLMYQPFHGASQMSLGALLDHANIGAGQQTVINWVAIMGLLVLGAAALPTMLVFLLIAALGLLVGFVTLILRKLIIILTLIFVPVALILWILPSNGTQRLWKLWLDNFTKALLMFPLVVMLIAGGRILAYVAGTQGNGTFLNLLIVFVGFFGPLFIIPKAFKWGGSAMQFAGNMATNATKPIAERGGAGVRGIGERIQGKGAKAYDPNANRFARAARRIQSGHMIPPIYGMRGAAERSRRLTMASGDKWANERNDEAQALVNRTYEKALAGYDRADMDDAGNFRKYHQDDAGNYLDTAGASTDKKHAAFDRVATREQASKEMLTGVEAGKQALIDISGNDEKDRFGRTSDAKVRAAQAANKQLIDTHSEIELQSGRVQYGEHAGMRASETTTWRTTLTNSPPHYAAINNSRPDMAPDVIEGAEKGLGYTYQQAYADPDASSRAFKVRELDKARLSTAITRLTPEALSSAHYGLFQDITGTGDVNLSQEFATVLKNFQNSGSTVGVNAVGSLRGGKERHVNDALAAAGQTLNDIAPPRTPRTPTPPTP